MTMKKHFVFLSLALLTSSSFAIAGGFNIDKASSEEREKEIVRLQKKIENPSSETKKGKTALRRSQLSLLKKLVTSHDAI